MIVLRCTQKLLVRLKQTGDLQAAESTTRLGDWYGNILRIGRRQHLLFISERSRLPVVLLITEAKRLSDAFPDAVCECWPSLASPLRTSPMNARYVRDRFRSDQESQPAWHLERLRIHGTARKRQSG
jgi:hypothetical protein